MSIRPSYIPSLLRTTEKISNNNDASQFGTLNTFQFSCVIVVVIMIPLFFLCVYYFKRPRVREEKPLEFSQVYTNCNSNKATTKPSKSPYRNQENVTNSLTLCSDSASTMVDLTEHKSFVVDLKRGLVINVSD